MRRAQHLVTALPSATGGEAGPDFIAELPELAVLRARGEDALDFLARQLTSDVRGLPAGHSHLSAWCTAQGRVICVGRLLCRSGDHLYLLPTDLVAEVETRLGRYVLRSRVDLSDAGAVAVGCSGLRTGGVLREAIGRLPEGPDQLIEHAGCTVVGLAGPTPRYLLLGDPETVRAVRERQGALAAPAAAWRVQEIRAGVPAIGRAGSEMYLPQMLNLDVLGGLSFEKGCYPGQEIIARLKYRGEVKRRLFIAEVQAEAAPAPGWPIVRAGAEGGHKAGEVLVAERDGDGIVLLAVLEVAASGDTLHLGDPTGPVLSIAPLPYRN